MKITLSNVGRRFNQEWIFKHFNYEFCQGDSYAILGANGSGKSTLLSIIMGSLSPSEGIVEYADQLPVPVEKIYKHISFAAPYLDLIEEFTLQETLDFHFKFKKHYVGLNYNAILDLLGLAKSQDKALKYFSSGMKQRTKLVLAFCSDTPILLLDEPTSNLDIQGIEWYNELTKRYLQDRLVIVCSNQKHEYQFCNHFIQVADYK